MKRISTVFFASALVITCGCDSGTYKVLRQVQSPDRRTTAFLVEHSQPGLSSDTYYLLLSGKANLETKELPRTCRDQLPLCLTRGWNLTLRWTSPNELSVICDKCGIQPIDIMEKQANYKSIAITYDGFPKGTAKTCESDKSCFGES
jgi:hypothetical protein